MKKLSFFSIVLCMSLLFSTLCHGADLGSVVAVRGAASLERSGKSLDAKPRLAVELKDTATTKAASRLKLLFIDDSVLTLGENSRMAIDTFVHNRSDRGKSLFNLLDGKLRAVVGKTAFEVTTPTVVAAARGTVILFEAGLMEGKAYSRITSLEGLVDVRPLAALEAPPILLSPGMSILVRAGETAPAPEKLAPATLRQMAESTSTTGSEILLPPPAIEPLLPPVPALEQMPLTPPIDNQQPSTLHIH